jgi:hypothetical protein
MTNPVSPETFIDLVVKKNELGQPFALMDHRIFGFTVGAQRAVA